MIVEWALVGVTAVVAAMAFARARRTAKRLERIQESYWDLRYELGQLQARVNKLDEGAAPAASTPPHTAGAAAFVPLSSLKR